MKKIYTFLMPISVFLLGFLTFFGCSGINEFAKYDITNSKIYFKSSAKHSASNVKINIKDFYFSDNSPAEIILTEIGENVMSENVQEKVDRAFQPDTVATKLSDGVMGGLRDYFNFTPVESSAGNPDYLFETRLEKFELSSSTYGIQARISAEILIVDRKSAKTVWRNTEFVRTPLKESLAGYYPNETVRTAVSIVNAVRLMEMTKGEIKDAIYFTTDELAYELTDILRNDIAYRDEGK